MRALCYQNANIDLGAEIDIFSDCTSACQVLANREKAFEIAIEAIGKPYIRRRDGGFAGLFRIIVEQQVSVASAQAIWKRCEAAFPAPTPQLILDFGTDGLKSLGLSGPKIRYVEALASDVLDGRLNFSDLPELDNDNASALMMSVKGIGPWSAAIYLLFCEGRIDIWPQNDVALKHAFNAAKPRKPDFDQKTLDARSVRWGPYRGVAAHVLWTYYAYLRARTPI